MERRNSLPSRLTKSMAGKPLFWFRPKDQNRLLPSPTCTNTDSKDTVSPVQKAPEEKSMPPSLELSTCAEDDASEQSWSKEEDCSSDELKSSLRGLRFLNQFNLGTR